MVLWVLLALLGLLGAYVYGVRVGLKHGRRIGYERGKSDSDAVWAAVYG